MSNRFVKAINKIFNIVTIFQLLSKVIVPETKVEGTEDMLVAMAKGITSSHSEQSS